MRLRTLPVSIAGVLAGCGCAIWQGGFSPIPALLCLLFALSAQIASNFGNEYYDFKNGVDHKGRKGFRRGVTEGDISPQEHEICHFCHAWNCSLHWLFHAYIRRIVANTDRLHYTNFCSCIQHRSLPALSSRTGRYYRHYIFWRYTGNTHLLSADW